ncbi:type I restriction-modification system specificity subunit [Salinisphaera sp. PC39]|uniref:restriction endonuclease subunit S n=1 Tax=Salinisphaera sp. PC39 TaxID=1304156 RepID=UPI003340964D
MGDELSQNNYQTVELGDLGRIVTGKTPSTKVPEYFGGDIPFVTPSDMDGRKTISSTDRYLTQDGASAVKSAIVPEGSVMVSCIGSDLGKVAFTGRMSVTNQQINTIIVDRDRFNAEYIYYDLSTRQNELKTQGASGSAVPILNKGHFSKLHIKLPPLDTQAAIANILSAFDNKIELNRQINRTLEAMARAIFKAWFVDFEPVKAKAASATSFRGMPQDVFDQLPAKLTESDLGPVPEGWTHLPIGDLVEVVGGGTPSTKNSDFWEQGEYPFCTPKDLSKLSAPILLDTERHITRAGVDKISSRQLPVGTVILSSRAPIGYLALAETPVSVNQGIIAMVTGKVPNSYILLWTEENMEIIKSRAGGSTFAEISKRNFRPIPVLRPDDTTLQTFGEIAQSLFARIASNERESWTLAAIRDTLLPKLISGEIRVPEALEGADGG